MTKKILLMTLFLMTAPCFAEESPSEREKFFEQVTEGVQANKEIQLDALEIRAKIYEPNVIYILDRTRLDLDYEEEKITFTPRMKEPILFHEHE